MKFAPILLQTEMKIAGAALIMKFLLKHGLSTYRTAPRFDRVSHLLLFLFAVSLEISDVVNMLSCAYARGTSFDLCFCCLTFRNAEEIAIRVGIDE